MIYNDDVKLIREMIDNINELSKKSTKHEENIIEYKYIPHDLTKLPFDIYIDDGNSYKNHKHPLWLYILKNDTLIPITIEQEPKVVEGEITKSEYISISEFICKYLKLLQDIADDLVDSSILNNNLQQQYRLVVENDNRGLLIEMARIRKDIISMLIMDLFIQDMRVRLILNSHQTTNVNIQQNLHQCLYPLILISSRIIKQNLILL